MDHHLLLYKQDTAFLHHMASILPSFINTIYLHFTFCFTELNNFIIIFYICEMNWKKERIVMFLGL